VAIAAERIRTISVTRLHPVIGAEIGGVDLCHPLDAKTLRRHGGTHVGGWTAKEIHQAILTTFDLSSRAYGLNQLRYDLRKLKGHALLQRDGSRYAYRLTTKGVEVALLFLFFHKRLCGPLANSRFHHQPKAQHRPNSRLAYPREIPLRWQNSKRDIVPQAPACHQSCHSLALRRSRIRAEKLKPARDRTASAELGGKIR
jgi:hypothetical protein